MRTLKVYLAAPYVMKSQMNIYASELRSRGIQVTSSWLDEPHKPTTQMHELTHEEHQVYAVQDVKDVWAADVLVFQTDPTKAIIRAGRHVEFGIAIGIASTRPMPIFVIGEEHENIFHHLPQVTHFPLWEPLRDFLIHLSKIDQE